MDPEKLEVVKILLTLINMAGTIGLWLWLRIERRNDKTNESVVALDADVQQLKADVAVLKEASSKAPNHGDLGEVYKAINELAGTVNQLVGENRGQSDTLRLILNRITERGLS